MYNFSVPIHSAGQQRAMSRLDVGTADLRTLTQLERELMEMGIADRSAVIRHLLGELCALLGAANGYWVPAIRDTPAQENDAWRVPFFEFYEASEALLLDGAEAASRFAAGNPDRMTMHYAPLAGSDRAARPVDLMPRREWEEDWYVRDHLSRHRFSDLVQGTSLVHPRGEVTLGFLGDGRRRFRERERDLLLVASAILRYPLRAIVLTEGWLGPDGTLTRRERQVLDHLLGGMSESEIAEELGSAANTVHHQASSVYRKLGVRGRTGLLALWAGR